VRRTVLALSAAALAAALTACGQDSSSSPTPDSGQSENSSGLQQFTDAQELANTIVTKGSEKGTAKVTWEANSQPGMECQVDFNSGLMACTSEVQEVVITDNGTYIKSPELARIAGDPSKEWLRTGGENPMEQQYDELGSLTDLNEVVGSGTTIANSTEEQVDGQNTVRYELVTDVQQAAAEAESEAAKNSYQLLLDNGVTELKSTLWIGEDGLPVKAEAVNPAMNVMGREIPETTVTMTYSDWGAPVQITEPPADQVQEMNTPSMPN
jgi:hypothetical protein